MREKKLESDGIETRRKMMKAGLAAAGGAGLLTLLGKKGAGTVCGSCAPGCEICRSDIGGGTPPAQN